MFLDENFLLSTPTARRLFHNYAENLPIIDYHCHLSAKEIAEDRRFKNITELWLEADHYKWRLERSFGVEEKYITGEADDKEKFFKWCEALSTAIGNPLYHWSHLELKKYFGFEGVIKPETAEEIWALCEKKLRSADFSARKLIEKSGVEVICTTDNPADSLEWHKKIGEGDYSFKVLPSFRPDRALAIEKEDFADYLQKLGSPESFEALKSVLRERLDYFASLGCRVSDHGMDKIPFEPASEKEIERIFSKRQSGEQLGENEKRQYKTALLLFLGMEYSKRDMVMQLHFGVQRDLSQRVFDSLGADAGIDAIGDNIFLSDLGRFLNALEKENALPKTVLYSLNPNDNAGIDTVMGAFQSGGVKGKLQHGSAWWFNDHIEGMRAQLGGVAAHGHLGTFIGMLTDSRSFLSYTRHDYFRRILCDMIGNLVENGEYPDDEELLGKIVSDICYHNAKEYFNF